MPEIAYLNGEFLPLREAKIAVTDYGFLFGYALYETLRTYRSNFFRLDNHLSRLQQSARLLEIPASVPELNDRAIETARRSGFTDARVRITITLGKGSPSPNPASCQSPTILITAVQFTPQPAEIYAKGYSTSISDICRDSHSILPGMKTITYLESMRARQIARSRGADEALFLNEKGYLAESSSANIFLVNQSCLKTPKLGGGILPGITREVIFELAAKLGVPCVEDDILPAELGAAQEAFLTNSLIEIMPITSIEKKALGSGMPGEITRRLIAAYKELVLKEVS